MSGPRLVLRGVDAAVAVAAGDGAGGGIVANDVGVGGDVGSGSKNDDVDVDSPTD